MSRPLKFRMWRDSRMQRLHQMNSCQYNFNAEELECEIMQYTGLKDNNNKEVYEGDILQDPHTPENDPDWERAEVYYDDELARFGLKFYSIHGGEGYTGHTQHIHSFIKEGYYVIGNIYENKNLLK